MENTYNSLTWLYLVTRLFSRNNNNNKNQLVVEAVNNGSFQFFFTQSLSQNLLVVSFLTPKVSGSSHPLYNPFSTD